VTRGSYNNANIKNQTSKLHIKMQKEDVIFEFCFVILLFNF